MSVLVAPPEVLPNDYVVACFHVGKIDAVRDDCWATQDREVLPIREPHVEGEVSFLMPVRNPIHFLAMHLRVPSPQLFVLLLDSPVQPPVFCRADRLYRNTVHHHGLGFFLLRHARPPARCSCRPKQVSANHLLCGRTGLPRFFLVFSSCACSGEETVPTAVSRPVCAHVRRRASSHRFLRWSAVRRK